MKTLVFILWVLFGGAGTELAEMTLARVNMSAISDPKSPVQFYFGNAARDLTHMLPPEDEEGSAVALKDSMERLESLVDEIAQKQGRLHFLLSDLKKIFGT